MSRKSASKKPKTHSRKKHTIDHEWLMEEFEKCYLEKGQSIPSIAKRYVRLKKRSTVGSIQGVLYEMRKKHLEAQVAVQEAVADLEVGEDGVIMAKQPNLVYERPSDLPKHYQVRADTPTVKSLQQKADYHLSQYKKALKEILEVIGGEQ